MAGGGSLRGDPGYQAPATAAPPSEPPVTAPVTTPPSDIYSTAEQAVQLWNAMWTDPHWVQAAAILASAADGLTVVQADDLHDDYIFIALKAGHVENEIDGANDPSPAAITAATAFDLLMKDYTQEVGLFSDYSVADLAGGHRAQTIHHSDQLVSYAVEHRCGNSTG